LSSIQKQNKDILGDELDWIRKTPQGFASATFGDNTIVEINYLPFSIEMGYPQING